jgi:hypothetical protein
MPMDTVADIESRRRAFPRFIRNFYLYIVWANRARRLDAGGDGFGLQRLGDKMAD